MKETLGSLPPPWACWWVSDSHQFQKTFSIKPLDLGNTEDHNKIIEVGRDCGQVWMRLLRAMSSWGLSGSKHGDPTVFLGFHAHVWSLPWAKKISYHIFLFSSGCWHHPLFYASRKEWGCWGQCWYGEGQCWPSHGEGLLSIITD